MSYNRDVAESKIFQAMKGKRGVTPVWLMRQAGRYLPEYRAIRQKTGFLKMLKDPEIVAEVTCQPVDLIGVDAAILFADILTLPEALGFNLDFIDGRGPVFEKPIRPETKLIKERPLENLSYLSKAIQKTIHTLPGDIPLIGFAGGPFTVLVYLIEGGSPKNFSKIMHFMHKYPECFHKWMDILTFFTIDYLNIQKQSGIDLYQLFESWGGVLGELEFNIFILPYVKKIFSSVDLPSIYYVRQTAHLTSLMDQSGADFLSVDHTVRFDQDPALLKSDKGIQGNLFNGYVYASESVIKEAIDRVMAQAAGYTKYIFNFNHGILPDMDPQKIKFVVDYVHSFQTNEICKSV